MKRTTFEFPFEVTRGGEPVRAQLIRALRSAVQSGRLTAGSHSPRRACWRRTLVSRGVIVEAYEQLIAEGYFIAQRGAATRVASEKAPVNRQRRERDLRRAFPQPAPPPRFEFRPGVPDVSLFPARA